MLFWRRVCILSRRQLLNVEERYFILTLAFMLLLVSLESVYLAPLMINKSWPVIQVLSEQIRSYAPRSCCTSWSSSSWPLTNKKNIWVVGTIECRCFYLDLIYDIIIIVSRLMGTLILMPIVTSVPIRYIVTCFDDTYYFTTFICWLIDSIPLIIILCLSPIFFTVGVYNLSS